MLDKYKSKRDFDKTPEPSGSSSKQKAKSSKLSFVVQEHHAQNLHWDFRLEREGVLASWALPKGAPEKVGEKHLAVAVEDHPLEYIKFKGDIPKGQYGAGHVEIWDSGTYEPIKWDEKVVEVILSGKKLKGRYSLVKTKGYSKKDNSWLIIKLNPKKKL